MGKCRALIYATFNGVHNKTNGIGTETEKFLLGMESHRDYFQARYGSIDIYIVAPRFGPHDYGYDAARLAAVERRVEELGGRVIQVPFRWDNFDFWSVRAWRVLCAAAASSVMEISRPYEESLLVAVCSPFLQVPIFLTNAMDGGALKAIIVFYSTSYVGDVQDLSFERLGWEYAAISSARVLDNVYLGAVSNSSRTHLIENYGACETSFVPFTHAQVLEADDFRPKGSEEVRRELERWGVPTNAPLVVAFGRGDLLKNFELLIEAMAAHPDLLLVLITTPPHPGAPSMQNGYEALSAKLGVRAVHVREYTRSLPMALCQWEGSRVLVVPSRHDFFPNIPIEVSIWAKEQGPVVVASDLPCHREQVVDGVTGLLFASESVAALSSAISDADRLGDQERQNMRAAAFRKAADTHEFRAAWIATLDAIWGPG